MGFPLEVARKLLEDAGYRVVRVRILPHYRGEKGRGELMVVKQLMFAGKEVELWCTERPPRPRGFLSK
ncbi:MAG TPA: hypothetical protein GXX40_00500 [Firmicutes bacterium]|nr:hypothetical protein [Bacillota bacterium]